MSQTIVEKIAQQHMTEGPSRPLCTGDFLSIRPVHVMTHDNTSAVMGKFKGIGAKRIHDSKQLVFALDHDIQNQDESNLKKYRAIEAFAKEHAIDFYPAGSGIGRRSKCGSRKWPRRAGGAPHPRNRVGEPGDFTTARTGPRNGALHISEARLYTTQLTTHAAAHMRIKEQLEVIRTANHERRFCRSYPP